MKIRIKSEEEIWKTLNGNTVLVLGHDMLFVDKDNTLRIPFNIKMFKCCGNEFYLPENTSGFNADIVLYGDWMWSKDWYTIIEPAVDWITVKPGTWIKVANSMDKGEIRFDRQFLAYLPNARNKFVVVMHGKNSHASDAEPVAYPYAWLIKN